MAQVKIYGLAEQLNGIKAELSDTIHACLVEAFQLPAEKRFQRFIALDRSDFVFPADRSAQYLIIEVSCFAGRTVATKKTLIRLLFERLQQRHAIAPNDLEITISETPPHNWGIRGLPADELALSYSVDV
jgi:phenylpyruvate tautomerase PptA (4-oxalocrotonate tautomerase family)